MKYIYHYIALIALVGFASCTSTRYVTQDDYSQDYTDPQTITYQQFYDDLNPYGDWVNYQNYGYVWVPNQAGFRPYYTNGYWVYTNYGWTWTSNYNWGWAPFHYGRWIQDMSYGWMWIPGTEWAPAWVAWRGGGNYYGWAPLGPGMDINASPNAIPYNNWAFVPNRYINSRQINNYYVNQGNNVTIINNTTIINNNTTVINNGSRSRPSYNRGPSVTDVERVTNAPIRQITVQGSDRPGTPDVGNRAIRVFRPTVQQPANNSGNARPTRVVDLQQVRERNTTNGNSSAPPVREIPTNQTPQINRNEPPVNQDRNSVPVRTLPNNNQTSPNRNVPPQNENNTNNRPEINNAPVRTPVNTNPATQRQETNNDTRPANDHPATTPVRNTEPVRAIPKDPPANITPVAPRQETKSTDRPVTTQPSAPVRKIQSQKSPATQTSRTTKPPVSQPVRKPNTVAPSTNRSNTRVMQQKPAAPRVVTKKNEISTVKPAQKVQRLPDSRG